MIIDYLLPCYTSKSWAEERAVWRHTWGTKAERTRGAETAASYSGSQWGVFISQPGLILAGRDQQADISVQLDQQAALEHPHHHLDQLGLVRSRAADSWAQDKQWASGAENTHDPNRVKYVLNQPWVPYKLKIELKERAMALILFSWKMEAADAGAEIPLPFIIHHRRSSSSSKTRWVRGEHQMVLLLQQYVNLQ